MISPSRIARKRIARFSAGSVSNGGGQLGRAGNRRLSDAKPIGARLSDRTLPAMDNMPGRFPPPADDEGPSQQPPEQAPPDEAPRSSRPPGSPPSFPPLYEQPPAS